ncbi:MAG: DUF4833 domain-containing protein [Bacteroidales bacterium]|nr:DUF4833 domain-containing protein [Bacteroidales bacterium]
MNTPKLFIFHFFLGAYLFAGNPFLKEIPAEGKFNETYLFKIERSRDADIIYYKLNINSDGLIDQNEPLEIFWIKHSDRNQKEPLTRIQNSLSYGVKYLEKTKKKLLFRFQSANERDFIITTDDVLNSSYRVYTKVNGKLMIFEKMYIHFGNESFWNPKIDQIDLHVSDPHTGKKIVDTFKP